MDGLPSEPAPDPASTAAAVEAVKEAPPSEKRKLRLDQALLMSEVQLLLADKRTAFALMRTGVAVSLLPLSIWTVLVATSAMWNPFRVMWLLVPVMFVALAFLALGVYLIGHALKHVVHVERTLLALRQSDTLLEELLYKERFPWLRPRGDRPRRGGPRGAT